MADQFFLTDYDGKRLEPVTVAELNAASKKGWIRIPASTNLEILGSSLSRAAKNIEGLVLAEPLPVVTTGWQSSPRTKMVDKVIGTLLGLAALISIGIGFSNAQIGDKQIVHLTSRLFVIAIAAGIFMSKKAGFIGGLVISFLGAGLTIYILMLTPSSETLPSDFFGLPVVAFCIYCVLRLRMRYVPTAISEFSVDPELRKAWSERSLLSTN